MLPKVDIVNDKHSLRNNDTLIEREQDNNNFLSINSFFINTLIASICF